jgi:ATP-dependent RNA helicase RhlE
MERVLVFARTKHGADKVVRNLARAGFNAAAIHGNKSQAQRERALAAFKDGKTRVLVATDIAARGIHVDAVSHVVNYDLPNVPESYVHRIGRTARAGSGGVAISFCNGEERAYLRDIEKLTRQTILVSALPQGFEAGAEIAAPRPAENRRAKQPGRPQKPHKQRHSASGQRRGRSDQSSADRRPRHGGLDQASGLPAFLVMPAQR